MLCTYPPIDNMHVAVKFRIENVGDGNNGNTKSKSPTRKARSPINIASIIF